MWFGKTVVDFNGAAELQGVNLVASTSNAFTSMSILFMFLGFYFLNVIPVAWVAYAFLSVPVVVSLAKLNVQASKWKSLLRSANLRYFINRTFMDTVHST
jgi:hypothetical protein